jgi:hypothetical protein
MFASLETTIEYDSKGKLICEPLITDGINQNEVESIFNTRITNLINLIKF